MERLAESLQRSIAERLTPQSGEVAQWVRSSKSTGRWSPSNLPDVRTGEQVKVGNRNLSGEVIGRQGARAVVQVYESTDRCARANRSGRSAIRCRWSWGRACSGGIFDGVQRPLLEYAKQSGDFVPRGLDIPPLDREHACGISSRRPNSPPAPSQSRARCSARVQETQTIRTASWCRPASTGELLDIIAAGEYTVEHVLARVRDADRATSTSSSCFTAGRCACRALTASATTRAVAADHRAAHPRHLLPAAEGRQGGGARTVRRRQDRGAAADRALVQRRHRDLRRLRRARQRAGGRAGNLPELTDPLHRPPADGTHAAGGQHLQHAGGGARSLDLCRHDDGRVLPRPGLRRGDGGRFHQPLGRGAARSRRPPRADAGGGGLPRLSGLAPRGLLRTRGAGRDPSRRARAR